MDSDQAKTLAISQIVREEFTENQIIGMLTGALLQINNGDDFKVIKHLNRLKEIYLKLDEEIKNR